MARKKVIRFEVDFEGVIFGLVSQLKDYRLCWHINKQTGFDLKRLNDIEIVHRKKNITAVFSLFRFEDDLSKRIVYMVSNKFQGEYLLPEIRQADFILVINGEVTDEEREEVFSSIKNVHSIQLVIPIEYDLLKSKENLVFE